jgi:hypothetical protein
MSSEENMKTAPCRYCGQVVSFTAGGALTEEIAGEMAALNCDCEEAVAYQRCMQQEKKAMANIQELFGEGQEVSEEVIAILNAAVLRVCIGEVEKISMNLPGGIKAAISRNSKEEIKVERTETKKRQRLS